MNAARMVCVMLFLAFQAYAANAASDPAALEAMHELARLMATPVDLARGREAYAVCRGCHRADASGKAEAGYPQLAGQHPAVLIKQLLDVRAGRRDSQRMHPFVTSATVAAEELPHIAAYLHALPVPTSNGKGPGRLLELGRHLYERDCANCHGIHGEGNGARLYPRVAGQHFAYLYRESRASRDHERRNANPDMVRVMRHYTDDDLGAVSDYMSRLIAP